SSQPRPVPDDLDRYIADAVASVINKAIGLGQQNRAERSSPARIRCAELAAEVSKPRRGQQRITDRVCGDVAVRVAGQSLLSRPVEASEVQFTTIPERVHINADADLRYGIRNARRRIVHPGTVPGLRLPGSRRVAFRPCPRSSSPRVLAR